MLGSNQGPHFNYAILNILGFGNMKEVIVFLLEILLKALINQLLLLEKFVFLFLCLLIKLCIVGFGLGFVIIPLVNVLFVGISFLFFKSFFFFLIFYFFFIFLFFFV